MFNWIESIFYRFIIKQTLELVEDHIIDLENEAFLANVEVQLAETVSERDSKKVTLQYYKDLLDKWIAMKENCKILERMYCD